MNHEQQHAGHTCGWDTSYMHMCNGQTCVGLLMTLLNTHICNKPRRRGYYVSMAILEGQGHGATSIFF